MSQLDLDARFALATLDTRQRAALRTMLARADAARAARELAAARAAAIVAVQTSGGNLAAPCERKRR